MGIWGRSEPCLKRNFMKERGSNYAAKNLFYNYGHPEQPEVVRLATSGGVIIGIEEISGLF